MLYGIPSVQGTLPVHSKQFIIFPSLYYSLVPMLQEATLAKLNPPPSIASNIYNTPNLACLIPQRNRIATLCSEGGSFSFNDVASVKHRSTNGDKTRSQVKNFCLLCCSPERHSTVISWHWLPRWLLDWLVNMYFSGAQQNNIPCNISHSISKTEVFENIISSLFLLEGLHYHYYKKSASEIVNRFK